MENNDTTKKVIELDLGGIVVQESLTQEEVLNGLSHKIDETFYIKEILTSTPTYKPSNFYQQIAFTASNLWVNINNVWTNFINANGSTVYTNTGAGFKDEDAMTSNSAVATASQQSIKAYVDNSVAAISIPKISATLLAGENISIGNAVCLGNGTSSYLKDNNTTQNDFVGMSGDDPNNSQHGNVFKTSSLAKTIKRVKFRLNKSTAGSKTCVAKIYAVSGSPLAPTGSALGTSDPTAVDNSGYAEYTFTFATPVTVSTTTSYAVICKQAVSANADEVFISLQSTDVYANGHRVDSSDSGSTWSGNTGQDVWFKIYEVITTAGSLYKAKALEQGDLTDNFIGFADATINSGNSGVVNVIGVDDNQSGLTAGQIYYLSDTAGAISTTAGTITRRVGLSKSATEILKDYFF